jgi:hypothetical protein
MSTVWLQEFHMTMDTMKDALKALSEQRPVVHHVYGGVSSGLASAALGNLAWLLRTAGGYAQRALSKADVAAVFLSRKVLLDQLPLQGGF